MTETKTPVARYAALADYRGVSEDGITDYDLADFCTTLGSTLVMKDNTPATVAAVLAHVKAEWENDACDMEDDVSLIREGEWCQTIPDTWGLISASEVVGVVVIISVPVIG